MRRKRMSRRRSHGELARIIQAQEAVDPSGLKVSNSDSASRIEEKKQKQTEKKYKRLTHLRFSSRTTKSFIVSIHAVLLSSRNSPTHNAQVRA